MINNAILRVTNKRKLPNIKKSVKAPAKPIIMPIEGICTPQEILRITLHGEFTDLNTYVNAERSNRFMGAKIKKDNHNMALAQMTLAKVVTKYPVDIHMHWVTPTDRKDPDNTSFCKKFILDALVEKGILIGDRRKHIRSFRDTFGVDKTSPKVQIEIIS